MILGQLQSWSIVVACCAFGFFSAVLSKKTNSSFWWAVSLGLFLVGGIFLGSALEK